MAKRRSAGPVTPDPNQFKDLVRKAQELLCGSVMMLYPEVLEKFSETQALATRMRRELLVNPSPRVPESLELVAQLKALSDVSLLILKKGRPGKSRTKSDRRKKKH